MYIYTMVVYGVVIEICDCSDDWELNAPRFDLPPPKNSFWRFSHICHMIPFVDIVCMNIGLVFSVVCCSFCDVIITI